MPPQNHALEEHYRQLAATLLGDAYVRQLESAAQSPKRFGSTALKVNNKIFAMFTRGMLVVKISRKRVDELVEKGVGERFDPGHGRIMKEWLCLYHEKDWLELAKEAKVFVGKKS